MSDEVLIPEVYHDDVHGGYTKVAQLLNERFPDRSLNVTRQQVHVWFLRRERNGFPRRYPVRTRSGRVADLFHLNEVIAWYADYKPSRTVYKSRPTVDNESSTQ